MRVSLCSGAILIPEPLDFHSGIYSLKHQDGGSLYNLMLLPHIIMHRRNIYTSSVAFISGVCKCACFQVEWPGFEAWLGTFSVGLWVGWKYSLSRHATETGDVLPPDGPFGLYINFLHNIFIQNFSNLILLVIKRYF